MTKQDELLKYPTDNIIDTPEITIIPKLTDNNLHLCNTINIHPNPDTILIQSKKQSLKTKTTIKTQLEKATSKLYNIENHNTPEKTLNINLDLYQMEDY